MNARTILTTIAAAVTLTVSAATGQNDGIITIAVNKTSKALVERWIEGYKVVNPNVQIAVVSGKGGDADLTLVNAHRQGNDEGTEGEVTYVARYALLPVTSAANPLLADIQRKEWKNKDIKKLFFTAEDLDEEYEEEVESKHNKLKDKLVVYSGSSKKSVTGAFAAHFGRTADDLRGNRIAGDDFYLLSAIEEDKTAVTFNALTNLYDLRSRTLKSDLALLPLGLKKTQGETLRKGNLDETLLLIESEDIDLIPVEDIGFTYNDFDTDIDHFLQWIVRTGQQYNHKAGFLRLTDKEVESQLRLLAQNN